MINSVITNVVPPVVPSSRKGIAHFGQGEEVQQPKTQPQPQAQVQVSAKAQANQQPQAKVQAQPQTTPVQIKTAEQSDTFTKQPQIKA